MNSQTQSFAGFDGATETPSSGRFDWRAIVRLALTSRAMDDLEETRLFPERKIMYQFSARGHEVGQILLGTLLDGARDAVSGYYRSRPLLLTVGLSIEDAFAGGLARSGSMSEGRDVGTVYNLPRREGVVVLPMAGGVGTQYTTIAGWAQAIAYRRDVLGDETYRGSIAVALGGDGSVATNGFWSALTIATTRHLPMLFVIEDNGFGISVPSTVQTPGGNIAENLASFRNIRILEADSSNPSQTAQALETAVAHVREESGPALIRLTMPRLCGHSGQDTQAYKTAEILSSEQERDPLLALEKYLVPDRIARHEWNELQRRVREEVEEALRAALARPEPHPSGVLGDLFAIEESDSASYVKESAVAKSSLGPRINMLTAIRQTLQNALAQDPRTMVFGEDVGAKGGVHAATMGLQADFGAERVFDTSLSEEGIIGTSVGMALNGLRPIAEIQFRKYADPATEQLNDCGTIRWRTAGRFAAPIVVRIPGGFAKCGDPWHSECAEVQWAHAPGWQVIFPSNAEDAVGLLRTALSSQNPSIFFEHRALLDSAWARRPYPGDGFRIPLGKAKIVNAGRDITVVTWGAMVERCLQAAGQVRASVEIIDLRTIVPWDREAVIASVEKTSRCLVVHEDRLTAGFGAEICSAVACDAFSSLDAPVERLAVLDVPIPYNVGLMNAVLPSSGSIEQKIKELLAY